MPNMTREEFFKVAVTGTALTALIPEASLAAWEKQAKDFDFVSVFIFKDGRMYGLGYALTGNKERDKQGIKWLHRFVSSDSKVLFGSPPLEWEIK